MPVHLTTFRLACPLASSAPLLPSARLPLCSSAPNPPKVYTCSCSLAPMQLMQCISNDAHWVMQSTLVRLQKERCQAHWYRFSLSNATNNHTEADKLSWPLLQDSKQVSENLTCCDLLADRHGRQGVYSCSLQLQRELLAEQPARNSTC